MTTWSNSREKGSLFWLSVITGIYKIIGRRLCTLLMYPIIVYYFFFGLSARQSSRQYLQKLYKFKNIRVNWVTLQVNIFRHLLEFSFALVDKFAVWHRHIPTSSVAFEGKDLLLHYLNAGQGIVILGAHLGNTEVLRAVTDELGQATVNALTYTEHNPAFNSILSAANPNALLKIISTKDSGPDLAFDLQQKVSQGEIVAVLGDRIMPNSPEKNVEISFLGENALFPTGPFIIAYLLECPVFLVFCLREKNGDYRVFFEPFAEKLSLPRKDRARLMQEAMTKFVRRVEHYCLLYPLQWFNFYDFWKK